MLSVHLHDKAARSLLFIRAGKVCLCELIALEASSVRH